MINFRKYFDDVPLYPSCLYLKSDLPVEENLITLKF